MRRVKLKDGRIIRNVEADSLPHPSGERVPLLVGVVEGGDYELWFAEESIECEVE